MRVLHICPRPEFSGLEAYAYAMAEGQKRRAVDVSFMTLAGSPLDQKTHESGIEVYSISPGVFGKLKALFFLIKLVLGFRVEFDNQKETLGSVQHYRNLEITSPGVVIDPTPDIIHLHSTQEINFLLLPLFLSRFKKKRPKVVLQIHIWISHSKRDPLHALAYKFIDEVWCSSAPHREILERYLPIPPEKIRLIRYGRDTRKMDHGFLPQDEARKFLKVSNTANVIGSVARIDEGKGTHVLLEAVIGALDRHPLLHMVWIGPPTADDPKALQFSEDVMMRIQMLPENKRSRIHFVGAVPDSYKYMKAFDVFALPSYSECFALSLLEAQLAGLPVLATNSGGSPEVVRENETGWLFEPRSRTACASALDRALRDVSKWQMFGESARKHVLENHDFEKNLPRTIEAYDELLRPQD